MVTQAEGGRIQGADRPGGVCRQSRQRTAKGLLSAARASAAMAPAEEVDQALGGGILGWWRVEAGHLTIDGLAQILAELDAPLIERVDTPDHALHEHLVLVESDQRAEAAGADGFHHQRIARTVA